jgi:phage N-6-adenine-methyltransferase
MDDIADASAESLERVLGEVRAACEAFGAAREGTHIAAYAQERVIRNVRWLLDEGRWALAGLSDAGALVDAIRLESYRLSPAEREAIERAVKAADASVSNRRIAKMLGVSHTLVNEDIGRNFPSDSENAKENNGAENASGNNFPHVPGADAAAAAVISDDTEKPYRTLGTGDNEWQTPVDVIERARRVLGAIDLDPASSASAQERVKAARFHTIEDDGLAHEWHGRVFLNPPYMQPEIEQFVDKLLEELASGRATAAIMLTHNSTDTAWFHRAERVAPLICFTRGRIPFESPTKDRAAPVQGQAIFYFGGSGDRFTSEFAEIGFIRWPPPRRTSP